MQILYVIAILIASLSPVQPPVEAESITWMSWEEAAELNKTAPKKIFVDMYTDWCGWCKKMDKSTFMDPAVVKYISENFYAVKFNAEQKEDIEYSGNTFKFVKSGRRGIHQLAYALLNGKASYPSFVYLDETFARIMISPGFKKPTDILPELQFAQEEKYKDMSWEEYKMALGGNKNAAPAKVDKNPTAAKAGKTTPSAPAAINKKKVQIDKTAETFPRFPGCEDQPSKDSCAKQKLMEYLSTKLEYPSEAKEAGLEAMPIVQFYVEADGSITEIEVLRGAENGFGEAAYKLVDSMNKMKVKWIPATNSGENIRAKYLVPIKYRLSK